MTRPREWIDTAGMRQEIDSLNVKLKDRPTREEMMLTIMRAIQEHVRVERRASEPREARLEASMIELREGVVNAAFLRRCRGEDD